MYELVHTVAEYISLVLTIPTVILGVLVIYYYSPKAFMALTSDEPMNETQMLVTGITIGFIGAVLDNMYWFLAWGSDLLELPTTEFFFTNGVFANVPFRQITGILAASFHIMPIIRAAKQRKNLFKVIGLCTISFAATLSVLVSM